MVNNANNIGQAKRPIKGAIIDLLQDNAPFFSVPDGQGYTLNIFREGYHGRWHKLGGFCSSISDLLTNYLNSYFAHKGIDGECITIAPDFPQRRHVANLVRVENVVLLVDGSVGQFISHPAQRFDGFFCFVGTRAELRTHVEDAVEKAKNFIRTHGGEDFANASDAWLGNLQYYTRVGPNDEMLFSFLQSAPHSLAWHAPLDTLWEIAWHDVSIPATIHPANLSTWGGELVARANRVGPPPPPPHSGPR